MLVYFAYSINVSSSLLVAFNFPLFDLQLQMTLQLHYVRQSYHKVYLYCFVFLAFAPGTQSKYSRIIYRSVLNMGRVCHVCHDTLTFQGNRCESETIMRTGKKSLFCK